MALARCASVLFLIQIITMILKFLLVYLSDDSSILTFFQGTLFFALVLAFISDSDCDIVLL